jgi:protein-S-isoprenylcysteine O-methyltransferase Ste14
MTVARSFDWFQLVALACLLFLGIGRATVLYARGVRVVVVDWKRTAGQALEDLVVVLGFLLWAYEIVAYAWPLGLHLAPVALGAVLIDAVAVRVGGALLVATGLLVYGLALRGFGASWRLGIDRKAPGALVTDGIFARTRNPVYVGLDLFAVGTFLVQGRLIFLLLALVLVVMLHRQMLREEHFLTEAYGDAYRDYRRRVRRYVGWKPKSAG